MKAKYCGKCRVGYEKNGKHHCDGLCSKCYRPDDECKVTDQQYCQRCARTFRNDECFKIHARVPAVGKSFYQKFFVCLKCEEFVSMISRKQGETHVCGESYCKVCSEWGTRREHKCFMQVLKPEKFEENPKYIFFDFETYEDDAGLHILNLVIAQYTNGEEFRFPPDGRPMKGYDVVMNFGKWLFQEAHKGHMVFAHNFRGNVLLIGCTAVL